MHKQYINVTKYFIPAKEKLYSQTKKYDTKFFSGGKNFGVK